MAHRLNSSDRGFNSKFEEFLRLRESDEQDVSMAVKEIIASVRADGDTALIALTDRFDRLKLTPDRLRITDGDMAKARKACGRKVLSTLKHAARRIRNYHVKQLPKELRYKDRMGVELGWRWNPIDSVGLYVPGATASY